MTYDNSGPTKGGRTQDDKPKKKMSYPKSKGGIYGKDTWHGMNKGGGKSSY